LEVLEVACKQCSGIFTFSQWQIQDLTVGGVDFVNGVGCKKSLKVLTVEVKVFLSCCEKLAFGAEKYHRFAADRGSARRVARTRTNIKNSTKQAEQED